MDPVGSASWAFRRAKPKMGRMEPAQRRRLITDLTRLTRSEFEQVVDEVRSRPNTEEQAVAAFRAAFEQRAAESPWSPTAGLLGSGHEEE
jgi:hypothetical protein